MSPCFNAIFWEITDLKNVNCVLQINRFEWPIHVFWINKFHCISWIDGLRLCRPNNFETTAVSADAVILLVTLIQSSYLLIQQSGRVPANYYNSLWFKNKLSVAYKSPTSYPPEEFISFVPIKFLSCCEKGKGIQCASHSSRIHSPIKSIHKLILN